MKGFEKSPPLESKEKSESTSLPSRSSLRVAVVTPTYSDGTTWAAVRTAKGQPNRNVND